MHEYIKQFEAVKIKFKNMFPQVVTLTFSVAYDMLVCCNKH